MDLCKEHDPALEALKATPEVPWYDRLVAQGKANFLADRKALATAHAERKRRKAGPRKYPFLGFTPRTAAQWAKYAAVLPLGTAVFFLIVLPL